MWPAYQQQGSMKHDKTGVASAAAISVLCQHADALQRLAASCSSKRGLLMRSPHVQQNLQELWQAYSLCHLGVSNGQAANRRHDMSSLIHRTVRMRAHVHPSKKLHIEVKW